MSKEKYKEYLQSYKWETIREQVKRRDGYKCVNCGCRGRLECHHKNYRFLYREEVNDYADLVTLCRDCHQAEHDSKNNLSLAELEKKVSEYFKKLDQQPRSQETQVNFKVYNF